MTHRKPSMQEIMRRRKQSEFVGRDDQLTLFRRNLAAPDDERIFVFNVFGQGGVGKSTLLKRYRELARADAALTALTTDAQTDIIAAMDQLATDFAREDHPLPKFAERYRTYRKLRQELESDPDAPSGFSSLLTRTLVKGGFAFAKSVPGGGLVDLVDSEAVASKAGDWAEYVARKLRNNTDEIRLVREPLEELTKLWIQDLNVLAEKHTIVLFFDVYERTSPHLDAWLRDVLGGEYGACPLNLLFVIAGRDELDRNRWVDLESFLARISLAPFTDKEARAFLERQGITNEQVITVILKLSGGLPLLVATLAAEHPDDPSKVGDPTGTAVERFLMWTEDPILRRAAVDAALPRMLNRDIIALLVEDKECDRVFAWLCRMPFVQERADGWDYHLIAREQMQRSKRRESQQSWTTIHEKLAQYYEQLSTALQLEGKARWRDATWRAAWSEATYHRLCASIHQHRAAALNDFLSALDARRTAADEFALSIQRAEEDLVLPEKECWGKRMYAALDGYDANKYEDLFVLLSNLLVRDDIQPTNRTVVLSWRGDTQRLREQYDEALADLSKAIELDPNSAWAYGSRGETQRELKQYDEALADLSKAIELDPNSAWAYGSRGETQRELKQYDLALADLSKAIELAPSNDWRFYERALVYQLIGNEATAASDFTHAIQLARGKYENASEDWQNAFNLALYLLASAAHDESQELYTKLAQQAPAHPISVAISEDLGEYLSCFPANTVAQSIRAQLQARLNEITASP